jgi:hypothetical protein
LVEVPLNGVICVTDAQLQGKKWNSLLDLSNQTRCLSFKEKLIIQHKFVLFLHDYPDPSSKV